MSPSKFIGLTTLTTTLVVIALVGIIVHWWFAEPAVWLSSSSPDHTYKVELTGDKGRGGVTIPAVVKYNLIKNGHLLAKNQITIESRRERGYDHKGSRNNLNIPASAGCNP